jgi:NADH-quinone oxidoreductase subunit E
MMVEARKDDDGKPEAQGATVDLSRFAEASAKLFAEQTSAMAVMTAYGMSVAAQMTSMMLGSLRVPGAGDAAEPSQPAASQASEVEPTPSEKVVPLRPRAPKASDTVSVAVAKPASKAAKAAPRAPAARPVRTTAKAVAATSPASDGDDLKKISGIGPRLEQELKARGIRRYSDIAALSKSLVKTLDSELGLEGRIAKDDWAGQAKALSGGKG